MNPRGRGVDDELVNLGLILVASAAGFAAVLWLAGVVLGTAIVGVSGTLAVRSVINSSPVAVLRGN